MYERSATEHIAGPGVTNSVASHWRIISWPRPSQSTPLTEEKWIQVSASSCLSDWVEFAPPGLNRKGTAIRLPVTLCRCVDDLPLPHYNTCERHIKLCPWFSEPFDGARSGRQVTTEKPLGGADAAARTAGAC